MNTFAKPLTDAEMDRLDDFLLSRLPDERATDDSGELASRDKGVLCISELHGYFAAIATVPKLIQATEWLPHMWGDFSPVWESEKHGAAYFALLRRFKHEVTESLQTPGFLFDPCFNEQIVDGKAEIITHDWCSGYLRGSQFLPADGPYLQDPEFSSPMMVIKANSLIDGVDVLALMAEKDPAAAARLRGSVPEAARDLFAFWAPARQAAEEKPIPVSVPKHVGRNEPCPCGSGKKFKQCCLH